MARPKKTDKLVAFTVMLPPKEIAEIKRIAEKAELSAGKLARNCIMLGLDEVKGMERLGIIQLIGGSRRTIDQFKKRFNIKSDFKDIDNNID